MKLVKCKFSNRFLIRDEWYEVTSINYYDNGVTIHYEIHYELVNHTHKRWNTNWYHETNFYTLEELRDISLDEILQKVNFLK
jgi:hypothetical protein